MYVASLALAAPGSDATDEAKLSSGLGGRSSNKALATVLRSIAPMTVR